MKKITLASLFIFVLSVLFIAGMNFFYPPVDVTVPSLTVSDLPFSMAEVEQHSTQADCYLIVKDKVYDVSSFISQHPGGKQSIVDKCGQEATAIFSAIHSNFAWDLLGKYYIGVYSADSNP